MKQELQEKTVQESEEGRYNLFFKTDCTRNPYIAGPPVSGKNFYGREKELCEVLDAPDLKLILFIATRRMGKTSLCHQIQRTCEKDSAYDSNFCIPLDLEGIRDVFRIKKKLLRCSKKVLKKEAQTRLQDIPGFCEFMEEFCALLFQALPDKKTIILLIDEPEVFLHFAKHKQYDLLADFKDAFETISDLRVVFVSPRRIQDLICYHDIPCLLDNFETRVLKKFSEQEAEELIQLKQHQLSCDIEFGTHLIRKIINISNQIPFYIQKICENIFDDSSFQEPSQIIESLIERQTFLPYFTSDFNGLHLLQKVMLLRLFNSREPQEGDSLCKETEEVIHEIRGERPSLKYIDELVNLGILMKIEGNYYYFSSELFESWIKRDFPNLWSRTIKEINDQKVSGKNNFIPKNGHRHDLREQTFPSTLTKKIVDFLTSIPNAYDSNTQRALIERAGLDSQLQDQIDFAGPSAQFYPLLVPILRKYGKLEDRRNALEALLEAAKNYVGKDRKEYCDTLIQALQQFQR